MRKLQQKLSKVYLRQQAKGGIIDLEEEGRRMLVVTRGEEDNSSGTEFTELSPTDYQLGRHLPNPQKTHPFKDCVGIPCPSAGPTSQPTSPKKQQEEGGGGHWKGSWQGHAGRTTASEKKHLNYILSEFSTTFYRSRRRRWQERGKSRREK